LQDQLAKVQNLVDLTRGEFQVCVEEYQAMASQEINRELLETYFGNVIGFRRSGFDPVHAQLMKNFEQGIGNRGKTLWDAYNAITEWLDHQQFGSAEERLVNSWFGSGVTLRSRAHQLALNMVKSHSTETAYDYDFATPWQEAAGKDE
jgi:hypothetical protein